MSGGVSIISGIPRSVNNLRKNGDIGRMVDQSTIKIKGSSIFKE